MRLALVFNPFSYKLHEENLRVVQKYFGLFPPLSLTWVAAIARDAGHEVIIVDARTLQLPKPEVADRLREFRPDLIGSMFRPWFMLKSTFRCHSFTEFWRKVHAFFDMMFSQEKVSTHDDSFVAYNENSPKKRRALAKWLTDLIKQKSSGDDEGGGELEEVLGAAETESAVHGD